LREEWNAVLEYLNEKIEVKELNETTKVFIRAVRWRLTQNDCKNRGYILENFPVFNSELDYIFNKLSDRKLKRKKPKLVPAPAPPKVSEKSIGS
jgi:adenylate kinase